jgi:hypothetical protein
MSIKNFDKLPIEDKLKEKINTFFKCIWKEKFEDNNVDRWISNFDDDAEKLNMLYLLSKFMYFGNPEIRQILISIYRDLYKYPIIQKFRRENGDSTNIFEINANFELEDTKTKFLGVGNPSESGVHILYYFRQENNMQKDDFIYVSDIFIAIEKDDSSGRKYMEFAIKDDNISRYIFIDDFCGSGSQVETYLLKDLRLLKKLKPDVEIYYFMMFATNNGIKKLSDLMIYDDVLTPKNQFIFNRIESIFIIDETYKTFDSESRYFNASPPEIDKTFSKDVVLKHGIKLYSNPLGYRSGELLISFFHNTPDNTLPIFWSAKDKWYPIFKRFNKIY